MKLSEFIANNIIDKDNYLYLYKFEKMFSDLHNGQDIISYPMKTHLRVKLPSDVPDNIFFRTKYELLEIFKNLENSKKINVLISNPDVDLPVIKDEYRYMSQDHIPFDQNYQIKLESMDISDFVDEDFINSIPSNVNIISNSVIYGPENFNMFPLGRDPKCKDIVDNIVTHSNKPNLCFYGCTLPPKNVIHWYGLIRQYLYDWAEQKDFVKCVKIEHGQMNEYIQNKHKYLDYLNYLSTFKFVIAPRGCGLDTYRIWDSLYLGCVPIVVKNFGHRDFEDLPILWINHWEDYFNLTEDYLTEVWEKMLDTHYNFEKLKFSYWEQQISEKIK